MENQEKNCSQEVTHVHPLLEKEFGRMTWAGWKDLWLFSSDPEMLMGLLHFIYEFPAKDGDWDERTLFLLDVADGYAHEANFIRMRMKMEAGNPNSGPDTTMQKIALKALKVLCDRWFADMAKDGYSDWGVFWRFILNERVFRKLMWFFDDSGRRPLFAAYNLNLPSQEEKGHLNHALRRFVGLLISETWKLDTGYDPMHSLRGDELKKWQAIFTEARPTYIRMLAQMSRLDWLAKPGREIDDASYAQLRALALKGRYDYSADHGTVAEGLRDGNAASRVLVIVDALKTEDARRARIQEAERKKREAESELEACGLGTNGSRGLRLS